MPRSRQLTYQLSTTRTHEDAGVSEASLPLCEWTHVAFSIEGRTATLFINGTLDSTRETAGAPLYNNGSLAIGKEGSFDGPRSLVRRVQFRPSPLSAADVAAEYAEQRGEGPAFAALPPDLCPADRGAGAGSAPSADAEERYALGRSLLDAPRAAASATPAGTGPQTPDKGSEPAEDKPALPLEGNAVNASDAEGGDRGKKAAVMVPPLLRDASKALDQFLRAEHHPPAMLAAAKLFLFGDDGVEPDMLAARRHFRLAFEGWRHAAAGLPEPAPLPEAIVASAAEAARYLGMMSLAGKGTAIDADLGEMYLRVAAAGDDPYAHLGETRPLANDFSPLVLFHSDGAGTQRSDTATSSAGQRSAWPPRITTAGRRRELTTRCTPTKSRT